MLDFGYYNMDCMEGMKEFPDKYFELAIVDPPYGLERMKYGTAQNNRTGFETGMWNNAKPSKEYFEELFRISQNQIIWGANNFTLPETEYFIIWDKLQTVDNFASAEYAWTNCKMPAKVFRYAIHKEMADRKQNGGKIHPTQKPIALYEWLLQNYAKKGDKILDTHCGSASSLIACHKLGFQYVGFELDEDYYKASLKRLNDEKSRVSLFDEPITVEEYKQDSLI
jgi:site-specific DNA-methyltransferase (adenine-specific)